MPNTQSLQQLDTKQLELSPEAYTQANLCVHCGLCLPACPTYTENQLEADSPRGRIHLMKAMSDGRISASDQVLHHLNLCLDCRACETACPSGVVYHTVIEDAREKLHEKQKPTWGQKLARHFTLNVFANRDKTQRSLIPARIMQRIGMWGFMKWVSNTCFPSELQKMVGMLPDQIPPKRDLWGVYPPQGDLKQKVGLFVGCVGSVFYQHVHEKLIELLCHAGCEVHVLKAQVCCGAIHHHAGESHTATELGKVNIKVFEQMDVVVNAIAGCGAMLKEYQQLMLNEPLSDWTSKVMDISELLMQLDLGEQKTQLNLKVTYHDACHLAHAQKVVKQPRALLSKIDGLTLIPLPESDMCCGAAGTYNLMQPEMAGNLANRKLNHIQKINPDVVAMGNIGCAMHLQATAGQLGINIDIRHPVELLHEAFVARK